MQTWINKAERFFTTNTVWIYLTLLLFFSYLLTMSELSNNWGNYFFSFVRFCLFFAPVLVFAILRTWLQERLGMVALTAVWAACFLGWPLLLFLYKNMLIEFFVPVDPAINPPDAMAIFASGFFLTIIISVLAAEFILLGSKYFLTKKHSDNWFKKINIEHMILFTIAILAVLLGFRRVYTLGATGDTADSSGFLFLGYKFISFTIQYLLIIFVYYFYYYINKNILIPKIFKTKGFIYYGFSVAAVVLFFYPFFVFLIRCLPMVEELQLSNYVSNNNIFSEDGGAIPFTVILLSVPIIISNQWFQQNSQIANLEKEKSATELNLLKQQINPHFFFNTLNNLYALSITKDKQTPEVILQLSELMRYVIYKGKEELVPLHEEVKYIEGYIQLQQIRLHKKLDFRFEKDVEDESLEIPPLLFITFVENAFKHGIEPSENDCYLHLTLKHNGKHLEFICKNSIEEKSTEASGIGLQNLRRRMALRFPGKHEITTNETPASFTASLKLWEI